MPYFPSIGTFIVLIFCPLCQGTRDLTYHDFIANWSRLSDLNRPPAVYDTAALPDELSRLVTGDMI